MEGVRKQCTFQRRHHDDDGSEIRTEEPTRETENVLDVKGSKE